MDLKDIAFGLQTKFEVTCTEQADLIKTAIGKLYDQEAKNQVIEYHLEWLRDQFDEYYGGDVESEVVRDLKDHLESITKRCHKAELENIEFRARSNATVVDAAQLAGENTSLRAEIARLQVVIRALRDEIIKTSWEKTEKLKDDAIESSQEQRETKRKIWEHIKAFGKKEAAQ